jgi:hypothetical protein
MRSEGHERREGMLVRKSHLTELSLQCICDVSLLFRSLSVQLGRTGGSTGG